MLGAAGALALVYLDATTALLFGIVLSLIPETRTHAALIRKSTKRLLPLCIVGLGFGLDLSEILTAGAIGFSLSSISIVATLVLGITLGRLLKLDTTMSYLLSMGTAICGGSAIVALAPVLGARNHQVAVSLGVVFCLNAVALFVFPVIGHQWGMSDIQFGAWSAIAIHDTSSVVAAAGSYSPAALAYGVPIKLVRALWILPLVFVFAAIARRSESEQQGSARPSVAIPWFMVFFLLASCVGTYLDQVAAFKMSLYQGAKHGMSLVLFLIGLGISPAELRMVGGRACLHALILWLIVSGISFFVLMSTF